MTTTLLDLVNAVSRFARTDDEVVATIVHLVNSGTVTLGGNFRGARIIITDDATSATAAA